MVQRKTGRKEGTDISELNPFLPVVLKGYQTGCPVNLDPLKILGSGTWSRTSVEDEQGGIQGHCDGSSGVSVVVVGIVKVGIDLLTDLSTLWFFGS